MKPRFKMRLIKLGHWVTNLGRKEEAVKQKSAKILRAVFSQRNFNPGNFSTSKINQISFEFTQN